MPYEQKNNPFKKLVSNIKSGLNIKAPNVKKEMDWKHGLGEFASKEIRRKPGESKFQYDVRMREARIKASRSAERQKSKSSMPDPKTEIKGLKGQPPLWAQRDPLGMGEKNPGDLRVQSRYTITTLPSAPGDPFKYDFDEHGNIMFQDTRKGEDADWEFPKPHQEKAIRERYTGSETGDLSSWYGHDTSGWIGSTDVDPITGDRVISKVRFDKKSYLPYDLAQKKYNPNYKGSKK